MSAVADPPASAPPAPAPAPAAPSPSPIPASAPPSSPSDDNPFADIDAAFAKVEGAPQPQPPTAPPKSAPAAPAKELPRPAAPVAAPKTQTPKELRQAYDTLKADFEKKTADHAALEKRIADLEARGKDTDALRARAEQLEKDLNASRGELRAAKREVSPDFKEKWDKPFDEAAEYARTVIEQLSFTDPESDTQRPAKWDDFAVLYRAPESKVVAMAQAMFGDAAPTVLQHRTELRRLDFRRGQALKTEQENWQRLEKEAAGKEVQQREQFKTVTTRVNDELAQKFDAYHDAPEDKESAELRQKGLAAYDAEVQTPQQFIVKEAHKRQRVAAFGPLLLQIQRLKKEIADLKGAKAKEQEGEPRKVRTPGGAEGGTAPEEEWAAAFKKHMEAP